MQFENLIINPKQLMQFKQVEPDKCLVLDLSAAATYQQGTVPDAIHLPFEGLVSGELPHPSMLPAASQFATALAATGYDGSQRLVAFDDELGLKAARLYWTLRMTAEPNHRFSYLNGGFAAWQDSGGQVGPPSPLPPPATPLPLQWDLAKGPRVTKEQIIAALPGQDFFLWDTRSAAEYSGAERRAAKGGHIPGAQHLEWKQLVQEDGRIKPPEQIKQILNSFFGARTQPIVAYCQAHRRSAFAFMVAAYVGLDILGYDGSWQEWGNRLDTPVASATS